MLKAFLVLLLVGAVHGYLFDDDNVPLLGIGLFTASLLIARVKVPRTLFPRIFIAAFCLLAYALSRLDTSLESTRFLPPFASGVVAVSDLAFFFMCFAGGAIAYAKTGRISRTLWYFVVFYFVAFILRNSLDITGLQQGYNLSPGMVLATILPLIFLRPDERCPEWVPYTVAICAIFWLALIGARTAFALMVFFLIGLKFWTFITQAKLRFILAFVGLLFGILLANIFYLAFATNSTEQLWAGGILEIFHKRIGTRIDIWQHLVVLIAESPWIGHGTEKATVYVSPLPYIEFAYHRDNLAAHSLYFEILYRLGVFGLFLFILVIFSIWLVLWEGRKNWTVRVVGVYVAMLMLFGTTSELLMFSAMRLHSAFAWAIIGMGVGAALRQGRLDCRAERTVVAPRSR